MLFIPVEAVHSQGDSITYVIAKDGLGSVKQEVKLGKSNSDQVVVIGGITEGLTIYLSDPSGMDDKPIKLLSEEVKAIAKKD